MIKFKNNTMHYYDKNGKEITDGCTIKYPDGKTRMVYLTDQDELGTDATNPYWIETGKAVPCEYGIYPLEEEETNEVEVVEEKRNVTIGA